MPVATKRTTLPILVVSLCALAYAGCQGSPYRARILDRGTPLVGTPLAPTPTPILPPAVTMPSLTQPPAVTQPPLASPPAVTLPPTSQQPTLSFQPPAAQPPASTAPLATAPARLPELAVQISILDQQPVVVGQEVTFQITVTNRGNVAATGLVITDQFDAGLQHEAAASPIEKDMDALAPGLSKSIGVRLRVLRPGQLCNTVEVRGDGGVRAIARGCVTAVAASATPAQPPVTQTPPAQTPQQPAQPPATTLRPSLSVRVIGPASQDVETVAVFRIEITNNGDAPLTNLVVADSYDPSLYPVEASDGYTFQDQDLVWKFGTLAVGKTIGLQLNCKCLTAAARACNRVKVTSQEGASGESEACLEIRNVAKAEVRRTFSDLSVEISDLTDPIAIGKSLIYEIRVVNKGQTADRNVNLLVVLPDELSVVRMETRGPNGIPMTEGQFVRFQPVAELAPGQTLTYRVKAHAWKAGDVRVRAILKSDGLEKETTVEETTNIFANP